MLILMADVEDKEIHIDEFTSKNGRKVYKCLICDRCITTKYSAKYHLHSAHGLSPVKRAKRSTNAKERCDEWNGQKRREDEQPCNTAIETEQQQHELEADNIDNCDSNASHSSGEDTLFSSSDADLSAESSLKDSFSESDEEFPCDQQPSSISESAISILSCFIRNNFSISASKDVLSTFKTVCSDSILLSHINYQSIWEQMDSEYSKEVHYCELCCELFPENVEIINCQSEGCNGLRYKDATKKIPRAKFVFANIQEQLKNLISSHGIWEDITKSKKLAAERQQLDPDVITDITDGHLYKKLTSPGGFLSGGNQSHNLTLLFNTDGVNLYSSSKVQLWPLFVAINELSPRLRFARDNVILAGIWQGKGKPPFKQFLSTFSSQMNHLYNHGFPLQVNGVEITIRFSVVCGTFDLPAKAVVLSMTQYNGKECCITCEDPGQTVKQGKGHSLSFPYRRREEKFPKRTTEDVIVCMQTSSERCKKKGFKGSSGLIGMKGIDLVNGIPPDYMHCVLLGVTKNLLYKWFSPTENERPYFVGKKLKEIAKRLKNIQPPESMERLPRDLEKNYANFKATELQAWLLYYGLPCLCGFLDNIYLEHFANLSEGIYLLLGENITKEDLIRAERLLDSFFQQFAELYSAGSCGLNVHNIGLHLVEYVRTLGPLWAWSCFAFEDCNSMITKAVHGTGDVTHQIMKFKQAQTLLRNGKVKVLHKNNSQSAVNCEIQGATSLLWRDQFTDSILQYFNGEVELQNLKKVNRISLHGKTFYSKGYSRMKKRICYTVMKKNGQVVVIHYFVVNQNDGKVYGVATTVLQMDTELSNFNAGKHLIGVKMGQDCILFPVDELLENLWVIKTEQNTYLAQMPNTHGHAVFK